MPTPSAPSTASAAPATATSPPAASTAATGNAIITPPPPPPKSQLRHIANVTARAPTPLPQELTSPLPPIWEWPAMVGRGLLWLVKATAKYTVMGLRYAARGLQTAVRDPARFRAQMVELWQGIKHEVHHFWVGGKLFASEVRIAATLVRRVGRGDSLTRRERMQLKRAVNDLLRMVPFIVIVIVPFAEFSLPVLLKIFPNMLPSQFEKAEYRQETYRKSLNVKLELHGILQEVLQDRLAHSSVASLEASATSVNDILAQMEAVRAGKPLPTDTVVKVAQMFRDEVTLDNLPRGQLAALAKFVGISPFAPEALLRFQLRSKMRTIKEDDKDLYVEGTDELTQAELEAACEARGMPVIGLPADVLRSQLDEWLALSVEKKVPMTLLLLSRSFSIGQPRGVPAAITVRDEEVKRLPAGVEKALQESISSMDTNVVTEVVLAQQQAAAAASDATVMEMKLESLEFQNELIEAEREAKESLAAADRAAAEAATKAQAVGAALNDPALKPVGAEVDKLKAAAAAAAVKAKAAEAVAAAKQQAVIRMRAVDAARAASVRHEVVATTPKAAPTPPAPAATPAAAATAGGEAPSHAAAAQASVSALRTVVAGATVAKENVLLNRIKAVRKQMDAAEALARGRIVVTPTPEAAAAGAGGAGGADDKATAYLKSTLDTMFSDLERQVASLRANVDLHKALAAVDKNRDGLVTREEIDQALRAFADSTATEAATAALIRYLDKDGDGAVAVEELQRFLERYATRVAQLEAKGKAAEAGQAGEGSKAPSRTATTTVVDATRSSDSESEGQEDKRPAN